MSTKNASGMADGEILSGEAAAPPLGVTFPRGIYRLILKKNSFAHHQTFGRSGDRPSLHHPTPNYKLPTTNSQLPHSLNRGFHFLEKFLNFAPNK